MRIQRTGKEVWSGIDRYAERKGCVRGLRWDGTSYLSMRIGNRLYDQCACYEGTLPDADHLCAEKYERIAAQCGKTKISCIGAA